MTGLFTTQYEPIELARSGDYAAAISELGELWPGLGKVPRRAGMSDREYGLLLLVCGMLTGKLSCITQVKAQEVAKDMLSESARLLSGEPEECAARLYLAMAYFDCGEYQESLAVVEGVLTMEADSEVEFRGKAVKALSLNDLGKPSEAWEVLESVKPLLPAILPIARGNYFLERGRIQRRLGNLTKAIKEYDDAEHCFFDAGSARSAATVSNNLAGIYLDQKKFTKAHEAARRAVNLFQGLKDKAYEAKAWDQTARIYLAENKYPDAERAARFAVTLLAKGDNHAWFAEALITHGKALGLMGTEQAAKQLQKAAEICQTVGDKKQSAETSDELIALFGVTQSLENNLITSIRNVQRISIRAALERHDQKIAPAAKDLGLARQVLERRLSRIKDVRPKKRKRRNFKSAPTVAS